MGRCPVYGEDCAVLVHGKVVKKGDGPFFEMVFIETIGRNQINLNIDFDSIHFKPDWSIVIVEEYDDSDEDN